MLELYKPEIKDLWFREKFMSDEETMSYNRVWGGTIPFPETEWQTWYDKWILRDDGTGWLILSLPPNNAAKDMGGRD